MTELKLVLAFVGMPGAGKTDAATYLSKKGIPVVRFGFLTDEMVREAGLPPTQKSEKIVREKIRMDLGMAAYAIKSKPKIEELLKKNNVVLIDGLYSWEEYVFLKKELPSLILIAFYAKPPIRYKRLSMRKIRPLTLQEARERDIAELDKLNKGGPIAIADYLIENNTDDIKDLYSKVDRLLLHLGVTL